MKADAWYPIRRATLDPFRTFGPACLKEASIKRKRAAKGFAVRGRDADTCCDNERIYASHFTFMI
jgi:hypothetical protein